MFLKEEESDANKKSKMSKIEELLQKCPLEKREDLMENLHQIHVLR